MKRLTTIFLLLSLLFVMPCGLFAQEPQEAEEPQVEEDNTLELNLNALHSDLTQLSADLQTYDDIDTYDYAFQEAGNRLRSFAAIVSKDSPLYETYDNCNQMYYQLQKLIDQAQKLVKTPEEKERLKRFIDAIWKRQNRKTAEA